MPRTGRIKKHSLPADPIYKNRLVTRLINRVMKDGKKTAAQKHVYAAFNLVKEKTKQQPLVVFETALKNIQPKIEVRPRRVGGAAYQIPMPVKGDRRIALSIRWLILAARKRPNKDYHTFSEKLAAELMEAAQQQGEAVNRKEQMQRMAEANRAFAHFRW